MFHFENVYLHNKKSDLVNTDIMNYTQVFLQDIFNTTSALYLSWNKDAQWISSGAQWIFKDRFVSFLEKNLEFFFLVYIQLILLVFWGKYCQIFDITKLENKTIVGALKFIEKKKKWKEKNGLFFFFV